MIASLFVTCKEDQITGCCRLYVVEKDGIDHAGCDQHTFRRSTLRDDGQRYCLKQHAITRGAVPTLNQPCQGTSYQRHLSHHNTAYIRLVAFGDHQSGSISDERPVRINLVGRFNRPVQHIFARLRGDQ